MGWLADKDIFSFEDARLVEALNERLCDSIPEEPLDQKIKASQDCADRPVAAGLRQLVDQEHVPFHYVGISVNVWIPAREHQPQIGRASVCEESEFRGKKVELTNPRTSNQIEVHGLPPSLHMERQYDDPRRRTLRMRWSPPICMSTSVAPPERGWRSMMMRPPYRRPTGRLAPTLGDSVRGWDTPQAATSRLAGSPHSDILQKGTVAQSSDPGRLTHPACGSDAAHRCFQYWRSDSILSRYCEESRSGTRWFAMSATTVT